MKLAEGPHGAEAEMLDMLFLPSDAPSARLFQQRNEFSFETMVGLICRVCRSGVTAAIDDSALEGGVSPSGSLFDVVRDVADFYRGNVCPDHDPGDEDRS